MRLKAFLSQPFITVVAVVGYFLVFAICQCNKCCRFALRPLLPTKRGKNKSSCSIFLSDDAFSFKRFGCHIKSTEKNNNTNSKSLLCFIIYKCLDSLVTFRLEGAFVDISAVSTKLLLFWRFVSFSASLF